ncbi:hypothetical protein N1851_033921 [Merluccius polli]|uniref:SCAN box domain-containing protein n=1 Tax=Merluccius polli TaxID=89951 RepID=A0AA47M0I6_MERPO|nr:hypothetical protein N1851_033921 [Merluccius polli]
MAAYTICSAYTISNKCIFKSTSTCVAGPQQKLLRWRVAGVNCHTGAQCGASPTGKGHGRACSGVTSHGQPPQHQPFSAAVTASGGEGRLPSVSSLPRIQPGAAQVQPHLCQPAQQPKAHDPARRCTDPRLSDIPPSCRTLDRLRTRPHAPNSTLQPRRRVQSLSPLRTDPPSAAAEFSPLSPSPESTINLVNCETGVDSQLFSNTGLVAPLILPEVATYGGECGHRIKQTSIGKQAHPIPDMATPPDYSAMLGQLMEMQRAQQEHHTALVNRLLDRDQGRPIQPARFLVKQTEADDVETFLLTFERTATREGWPRAQWTDLITPFLSGAAQSAYQDLCMEEAVSYDELKAEIQKRLGHTLLSRAQQVHDWTFNPAEPPRGQMYELTRLTNRWLVSEPSGPGPVERVVMDRYLRALPYEGQKLACQSNPQSAEQLVTLVEGYLAAHAVLRPGRPGKTENTGRPRNPTPAPEPPSPPPPTLLRGTPRVGRGAETLLQLRGGGTPVLGDVAMPTVSSDSTPRKPCGLLTVCWGQTDGPSAVTPVRLNGQDASALLDSGSAVTLVRPEYAPGPLLPGKLAVTCIHGETRQYPTASISVQTTKGVFKGTVASYRSCQ